MPSSLICPDSRDDGPTDSTLSNSFRINSGRASSAAPVLADYHGQVRAPLHSAMLPVEDIAEDSS